MRTPSTTASDFDSCRGATAWARPFASSSVFAFLLVSLCASLLALLSLVLAPAAQAAPKGVAGWFGNSTESGEPESGGFFGRTKGIAINLTGAGGVPANSVYVADSRNRVQQFDAVGNFIRTWGRDVISAGAPNNNGTNFEICDTTAGNVAGDCKNAQSSAGLGGHFAQVEGVAVNQTTGDVYTYESSGRRVQQFDATGHFIRAWGTDVILEAAPSNLGTGFEICEAAGECKNGIDGSLGGELGEGSGGHHALAVVPPSAPDAGNVLVGDALNGRVQEYESDGTWVRAFGWDVIVPGGVGDSPGNEEQTITIPAVGGTFTLTFEGQTTGAIAYNAPAATIETALDGLGTIDDVTVTGGPGDATGSTPYVVTFEGTQADRDVPQMSVNDDKLAVAVGHTLSCTGPSTTGTVTFQWLRNSSLIAGATSNTYTTVGADAGKVIQCQAILTHNAGSGGIQASVPTRVVAPIPVSEPPGPPNELPLLEFVEEEGDSFQVGSDGGIEYECSAGSWSGLPGFSYQWYRNGVPIAGATSSTYTTKKADMATTALFQCGVMGTNAGGSATVMTGAFYEQAYTRPLPSPKPQVAAELGEVASVETSVVGANFEVCTDAPSCKAGVIPDISESAALGMGVGQFSQGSPRAIAVDSTGAIYVSTSFNVQKFTPQAGPPELLAEEFGSDQPPPFGAPTAFNSNFNYQVMSVAIGPGDSVFVVKESEPGTFTCADGSPSPQEHVIQEFTSDGLTHVATHGICARVTSNSNENGFAINANTGEIYRDGAAIFDGVRVFIFGDLVDPTIALDPPNPTATSVTVTGESNPNSDPSYPHPSRVSFQLQYKLSSDSEWTTFGSPIDLGAGTTPVPFNDTIFPLQVNTSYDVRAIAKKQFGAGYTVSSPLTFTTLAAAPSIESFRSSEVRANSATLHAVIDPNGSESTYRFEYGTTPEYGNVIPVPDAGIGNGHAGVEVTEDIENLAPSTYHFRVVATNAAGTTTSVDQTFDFYPPSCPNQTVRQQTKSNYLPDCRGYELASARNAGGTLLFPSKGSNPEGGNPTGPSRIAYYSLFGAIPDIGEPSNTGGDLYLATRTSTGWETRFIGLPGSQVLLMGGPPPNGRGIDDQPTNPAMDRFLRWDLSGRGGGVATSSAAPYLFDPLGNTLARWPTNLSAIADGEKFNGMVRVSGDLSHMVFSSDIPFAEGGLPGDIYDNDTEQNTVEVVSRDPGGLPFTGSPVDVSEDGSNILMSSVVHPFCDSIGGDCFPIPPSEFFMRIDGTTYDVTKGHLARYADMSRDGSIVYFFSNEQVTDDDDDTSTDLFMWSQATNSVTRVSAGEPGAGGNSDSCNAIEGWTPKCSIETISEYRTSESPQGNTQNPQFFSDIYRIEGGVGGNGISSDFFVAPESGDIYFLSPEQFEIGKGIPGRVNMYVYRPALSTTQFVASLSTGKWCAKPDSFGCRVPSETQIGRIEVSPDGHYAAFVTTSQLTAYDNDGKATMYRYDAVKDEILCVSCLPSGEPPTSDVLASQNGLFMTDDGRTFFSTDDALTPTDTNEGVDVYEFVDGRPQLISGGTGLGFNTSIFGLTPNIRPGLIGVSADGTDAYFATFDLLVSVQQDRNGGNLRIYDARTGGGFPLGAPDLPCTAADECHAGNSTPPDAVPGGTRADLADGSNLSANRCTALSRRAEQLLRHAKQAPGPASKKLARRAQQLRKQAKRCAREERRSAGAVPRAGK